MVGKALFQSVEHKCTPIMPLTPQLTTAIERIAQSDFPVLIVGEPGVGKQTVATTIHAHSERSRWEFKAVRCSEMDEPALLAALSGKGTLYMIEVADLTLTLQDVIVNRVCSLQPGKGMRLVCGTSWNLQDEMRARRMREDFYYLISPVSLHLPPLRLRKSELLAMTDELLNYYVTQFDRPKPVLSEEMMKFLLDHSWPGNLTQLHTAMKTCVAIGDQSISLAALRAEAPQVNARGKNGGSVSLKEASRAASDEIERQLITEKLASTGWNRKRAAGELRISYKALLYKLKQIGMENPADGGKNGDVL
jgi:two-component system response regulator AtoC